jgi:TRAP-type C4-dicarboxylate transport system substrate-binding protein
MNSLLRLLDTLGRTVAWLAMLGSAGLTASAAEATVRVRLATLAPKDTSFHKSLLEMGDKWRQASGGGVTLTIYTDGTMGGEADMVRRMRVGQLQAAMLSVNGLMQIETTVSALQNMPMMFHTLDEVDFVREQLRPMLEKKFEDKGFVVLFWGDAGWLRFFTKQPAVRPADFKKMKFFVGAGDTATADIIKAVGMNPVSLEQTDILTSLQTGLLEAVPSVPFYALAGQFYGPARHMVEVNWAPLVGGTVITKKCWNAIPATVKDALRKAASEAGDQIKTRSRAEGVESVEAMKKRGLTVHTLTPENEKEWQTFAEEVYPMIRGKIVPADMFEQVQSLLKDYRAAGGPAKK